MPYKYPQYINEFLDQVSKRVGAENDSQLAKLTGNDPTTICNLRNQTAPKGVGPLLLLRMYDATGWSIEELRSILYQRPMKRESWKSPWAIPNLPAKVKPLEEIADLQPSIDVLDKHTDALLPRIEYVGNRTIHRCK